MLIARCAQLVNPTPTFVSGNISQNTTWTISNSPYIVTGNLTVDQGSTLTIKPGVNVKFDGNYNLLVNGGLSVEGVDGCRVNFLSNQSSPAAGDWQGIQTEGTSTVDIDYATIKHATKAVFIPTSTPTGQSPTIQNTIINLNTDGIYFEPGTAPVIIDNQIKNSTQYGIFAGCDATLGCNPTITNNDIFNDSKHLYFDSYSTDASSITVTAQSNWWGETDPDRVALAIHSNADDSLLPVVNVVPYLDSINGTPFYSVPSTPGLLSANPLSAQVELSWSISEVTADGYKVKYGTTSGNYTSEIDVGDVTSYVVNGLSNGTTYYFVVSGYNTTGESLESNELSAQPQISVPGYGADQCVGGTSDASSCFNGCGSVYSHTKAFDDIFNVADGWVTNATPIGWLEYQFTSPKMIAKYTINPRGLISANPVDWTFEAYDGVQWVVLDIQANQMWTPQISNEYFFSNLNSYDRYRLNISNNGGHVDVGVTEMEMMEITSPGAPLAVDDLAVSGTGSDFVDLVWSEPVNGGSAMTQYRIEYGTVSSGLFDQTFVDDGTPGATVNGLTPEVPYQFRVIAVNAYGASDPSDSTLGIAGGTLVSEIISSNTTWDINGSPYFVLTDAEISTGVTLDIDPLVVVKFNAGVKLTNKGVLNVNGTDGNQVVFTSLQASPNSGDWTGLTFESGSTSNINYATIEYATQGIKNLANTTTSIANSLIHNNSGEGIYMENSSPLIDGNVFNANLIGIYVNGASGTSPQIINNDISNNLQYGIRISNNAINLYPSPVINYNTISNNVEYNVFTTGWSAAGIFTVIDAEHNYWGVTTVPEIEAGLVHDGTFLPTLDYTPYLLTDPNNTITINNVLLTPRFFNPSQETTQIQFEIDKPADVTIDIYEADIDASETIVKGSLVKTIFSAGLSAGVNTEIWDGTDDLSQPLSDDIYVITFYADDGNGGLGFLDLNDDPIDPPNMLNVVVTPSTAFDAFKGERLKIEYDLSEPGFVSFGFAFYPPYLNKAPRDTVGNVDYWDGRDDAGNILILPDGINFDVQGKTIGMQDNISVIQRDVTLDIPNVYADPFVIRPLYNEVTQINYEINENATVTVSVLSLDGSSVIKVLQPSVAKVAGSYTIEWDGTDSAGKKIEIEGNYPIEVEAVSSTTKTRLGNVRIMF